MIKHFDNLLKYFLYWNVIEWLYKKNRIKLAKFATTKNNLISADKILIIESMKMVYTLKFK